MEAREAGDLPFQFRDDESVYLARPQALDALADGVSRGWVSELRDQGHERLCLAWIRVANLELHQHEEV